MRASTKGSMFLIVIAAIGLLECGGENARERIEPEISIAQTQVLSEWLRCAECSKEDAREYLGGITAPVLLMNLDEPLLEGPSRASLLRYEAALEVMHKKMKRYAAEQGPDGPRLSGWDSYRRRWMHRFVSTHRVKACWAIEAYAEELRRPSFAGAKEDIQEALEQQWTESRDPTVIRAVADAAEAIGLDLPPKNAESQ